MEISDLVRGLDTVWVLLSTSLIFFMQAGFGMLEAGLVRAKNTCNILTKTFLDFCIASLGVFILWFGWFGFNPGSTLRVGDGNLIARVPEGARLGTGRYLFSTFPSL